MQDAVDACRVSEELLIAVLKIRLNKIDLNKGFILSAYPCNSNKADSLDLMLEELNVKLDQVIVLDVDNDQLLEEMVGQSSCIKCKEVYNIYTHPPIVERVCDICGGRVVSPPKSYEESVANRLRNYDLAIAPVLKHYKNTNFLNIIEASKLTQRTILSKVDKIIENIVVNPIQEIVSKTAAVKKKIAKKKVTKKKVTPKKVTKKKTSKKVTKKK